MEEGWVGIMQVVDKVMVLDSWSSITGGLHKLKGVKTYNITFIFFIHRSFSEGSV